MTTSSIPRPPEGEPLIHGVCLIPEIKPPMLYSDPARYGTDIRIGELLTAFSRRFTEPYMVSIRDGLVRVGEPYSFSGKVYGDLAAEGKHLFLKHLREQLASVFTPGGFVVCLCGGLLTQGLRSTGLEFLMPCSSMEKASRRKWLEKALPLSTATLSHKLFGVAMVYGQTPEAKGNTKKSTPTVGV